MTGALEVARANQVIGSSLQAHLIVGLSPEWEGIRSVDWAELAITSDVSISSEADFPSSIQSFSLDDVKGVRVIVQLADGEKCPRCWKFVPSLKSEVCLRCDQVKG